MRGILNELKSARCCTILTDEVTSHNVEHLAICARFVDGLNQVREEFLGFIPLKRITGKQIADAITSFPDDNGIEVKNIRGQGYDGASNMASEGDGVQAHIREEAPLATYVHCCSHALNLVITKSCSIPDIRNILDRLHHCYRFFLNSPKKGRSLLELIVSSYVLDADKRKPLLDLCKTRWVERHKAYERFYQGYKFIAQVLELIGHKKHLETYGDMYAD